MSEKFDLSQFNTPGNDDKFVFKEGPTVERLRLILPLWEPVLSSLEIDLDETAGSSTNKLAVDQLLESELAARLGKEFSFIRDLSPAEQKNYIKNNETLRLVLQRSRSMDIFEEEQ